MIRLTEAEREFLLSLIKSHQMLRGTRGRLRGATDSRRRRTMRNGYTRAGLPWRETTWRKARQR